jgi:hypothetical protein
MVVLHSFDNLDRLRERDGVENLSIDNNDYKEGTGALVIKGDAVSRYTEVYCDISDILPDGTFAEELKLWLKALDSPYNFEIGVYAPDRNNRWSIWTSNEFLDKWYQKKLQFPSDFDIIGNPDIKNITTLLMAFSNESAQRTWKVDFAEMLQSVIQHYLTVVSTPADIPIKIDGAEAGTTPTSIQLIEGEHTIELPEEVE